MKWFRKKKEDKDSNEQKIFEKLAKYTVLLPPLVILLLTAGIYIFVLYQSQDGENLSRAELFKYWVVNLCPVAISISVGTLLYEFFGNVKYAEKRLKNIIIKSDYIDTLSYAKKKELRKNVIESIYSKNCPDILNEENNITTILNEDVSDILEDYYYEIKDYYIDVYKKDKYIEKVIKFVYEAKAINGKKHTLVSHLKVSMNRVKKECDESVDSLVQSNSENEEVKKEQKQKRSMWNKMCYCFERMVKKKEDKEVTEVKNDDAQYYKSLEVTEVTVNGTQFTETELEGLVGTGKKYDESLNEYSYSSEEYINKHVERFTFKDKISGSITYVTRVPLDDMSITIRTPKACKRCCIHIKSDAYRFEPLSFVFGSVPNRKKLKIYNSNYGVDVDIKDWMLPGEGVAFILQEMKNN